MKQRDPVMICILGFVTCNIYTLIWLYEVGEELKARRIELPEPWWLLIPILNFLYIWKWCEAVERLTGGRAQAVTTFIMLLFLGPIAAFIVQPTLNQIQ